MVNSFRDLRVWQKAMELADAVYSATEKFPRSELFGLTHQVRKAAVSIPSNIAEGRAIGGGRFLHHIRIALGSNAELQTQVELALRRNYLEPALAKTLLDDSAAVARMLHSMHAALKAHQQRLSDTAITVLLLAVYSATLT